MGRFGGDGADEEGGVFLEDGVAVEVVEGGCCVGAGDLFEDLFGSWRCFFT